MTKLGLISDVHATCEPLKQALEIFVQNEVDQILCAGDTAGYGEHLNDTIELLVQSHCYSILGNHDVWFLSENNEEPCLATEYFNQLANYKKFTIEEKKIYMVHARPPDAYMDGIKLLDEHGVLMQSEKDFWSDELEGFDADVLIVGHTHQVFAELMGDTLVINPGSTKFNHSCAILTLPEMQVSFYALSNQSIEPAWNWGAYRMTLE